MLHQDAGAERAVTWTVRIPIAFTARLDALSRRDQDAAQNRQQQERATRPVRIYSPHLGRTRAESGAPPQGATLSADAHMQKPWDEAMRQSDSDRAGRKAVQEGARSFPPTAEIRLHIGGCTWCAHGSLLWRGMSWLPAREPLTMAIIHPARARIGKNATFQMIWGGAITGMGWQAMSPVLYIRDCHCYGAHPSRLEKQGLLY